MGITIRSLAERLLADLHVDRARHRRRGGDSANSGRRRLLFESLEHRALLAGDLQARFEFTDLAGTPVQALQAGSDFLLRMHVRDIRSSPQGVFQAYFDVNYAASLVSVTGPITHGSSFNLSGSPSGNTSTSGLIDEVGGIDTDQIPPSPPGSELLLFSVPFRANNAGTLNVTADLADVSARQILFFDTVSGTRLSDIDFVGGTIEITAGGIVVSPTSGLVTTEAGGTATFSLVLSSQPTADVTIGLSSSSSDEGSVSPSTVTFTAANWNTPRNVTVTGADDAVVDGNRSYSIITAPATSSDPRYGGFNAADVSLTNQDNDLAHLTISAPVITETNADQTVNFTVSLDKAVSGGFTVAFDTASGTATLGTDFTVGTTSPLSFAGTVGETKNVAVIIRGDQVVEGNETFTLTLGAVTPATVPPSSIISTGAFATGTIGNDDTATLTLTAPTIAETNVDQTVNFTVSVDKAVAGGFMLAFSNVNGSADASDYVVSTTSPLSFNGTAAETKSISVTIKGDQIVEGNETFTITLGAVTAGSVSASNILSGASSNGAIGNDDIATLTLTAPAITETNTNQTVNFTASIDRAVAGGLTVAFNHAMGTADASDYTVTSLSPLTFAGTAGETRNIAVTINGDQIVEGNETFTITLGAVSAPGIVTGASATGTILNDDVATLTLIPPTIVESNVDQTVNFMVLLDKAVAGGFAVAFASTNGTADVSDYALSTASPLTFAGTAGESRSIAVMIRGDQVVEANETFSVTLGTVTTGGSVQAPNIVSGTSTTATIANDDVATLTVTAPTITETNSNQTVNLTVTVDKAVAGGFSVAFSHANGTAVVSDYSVNTSSPLSFTGAAGETKSIAIMIEGDQVVEGNETFTVTLDTVSPNSVAAQSITTGASVTATIANDDTATLTLTAPPIIETNLDQTVFFTATLDRAVAGGFSMAFSDAKGSAGAGDYVVSSANPLTFAGTAGETQNIPVVIKGDQTVEPNETFTITLGTMTPAAPVQASSISVVGSAIGTIANDDTATLTLSSLPITESNVDQSVSYAVTVDKAVEGGFTVAFNHANGSADASDYAISTTSPLTFVGAAGEIQQITATIRGDQVVEGDETFTLTLGVVTPALVPASRIITGASASSTITNDDHATLSFVVPPITESNADQTVNLAVRVDQAVAGGFSVAFNSLNGSADGSDYSINTSSPLTFTGAPGEIQNIAVTIRGDQIPEGNQNFTVTLGAVTSAAPGLSTSITTGASATVAIQDDDTATLTITAPTITESNADQTVNFTVSLDKPIPGGFTVAFTASNGTADANDYLVTTASPLTFTGGPGETKQIAVTIRGDAVVEGNETLTITLGEVTAVSVPAAGIATGASATATLLNDDTATLVITAPLITETDSDQMVNFEVRVDNAVEGGFTVAFSSENGTADNSDFTVTTPSPLSFTGTPGETKNITVTIRGDRIVEPTETFTMRLGTVTPSASVQASSILSDDAATGIIANDDRASLTIGDITKLEGSHGTTTPFSFDVTLSNGVAGGFDLAFDVNEITAIAGDDYVVSTTSPLHFVGNDNETRTITVQVAADGTVEADEQFRVALGGISNLSSGTSETLIAVTGSPATATITDDDSAVLSIANVTQAEGSGGGNTLFRFEVMLSQPVAGGFDLAFSVNGTTATIDTDFSVATTSPLHFAGSANESQAITVQVKADTLVEADEAFQVALGAINNLGIGIDPARLSFSGAPATGSITNDDAATIMIDDVTHIEGDTGQTSFLFTITLSNAVDVPVRVDFSTVDGTAQVVDSDYESVSGTLVFNPDEPLTRTVMVVANSDIRVEPDETFALALSNLQAGVPLRNVVLARDEGVGTIEADDGTLIEISDVQVLEGNSGTQQLVFVVTASKPASQAITVAFTTTDGTARAADGDYQSQQGTLTFVPGGELTQNITVTVNGDDRVELDESFRVVLSDVSPSSPDILLNRPVGIASIQNDDASQLRIEDSAGVEGDSGTTVFHFAVTLSRPVDVDVAVDYTTVDGTARVADGDYQSASGTLIFQPGESLTQTISVVVNADTTVEPDEAFQVELGNLSAGLPARAVTLEKVSATGTIRNDDTAMLTIAATEQPSEGTSNGLLTITTNRQFQSPVTLTLGVSGSATAGVDYAALATSITFPANTDAITIPVSLLPDQIVEGVETVVVTLTGVDSPLVAVGTPNSATLSIADNDTATLIMEAAKVLPEQGGAQTILITLTTSDGEGGTATLAPDMTLQADVVNVGVGTATAADLISLDAQTISFAAGSGNGATTSVTLTPVNDALVEGNETAQLRLQNVRPALANQVTLGNSIAAITIQDNDTATLGIESAKTLAEPGGAQTIAVTLTTSDGLGGTATLAPEVTLRADVIDAGGGSATGGLDYVLFGTQAVSFPAGAGNGATRTVTLNVTNDALVEGLEVVRLLLTNLVPPVGGQVSLGNTTNVVTIQDNDTASLSIENAKAVAEEGGAQSITVTLTTSDGAGGTANLAPGVSLQAQVVDAGGGTATSGTDYQGFGTQTVSFAAGVGSGTTAVVLLGTTHDTLVEGNETVQLRLQTLLTSLDGQVTLGNTNNVTTIQDNDRATISIEATKAVTEPGGAQTILVTLITSDGAGGTATLAPGISLEADVVDTGGGSAGNADYSSFGTQTVRFSANAGNGATATVTATVANDALVEGSETVLLRLQNLRPTVDGQGVLGNPNSVVTIQDNDSAQLSIEATKTFPEQGGPQTIVLTLVTSDGAGGAATLAPGVTLQADVVDIGSGTGTSAADYVAFGTQTVSFGAGAGNHATTTVTFRPTNDTLVEGSETVNLRLQNLQAPAGEPTTLGNTNMVVTIQDNDTATLSIEASKNVMEAGGAQSLVVTLATSDGAGGTATLAPGMTLQADVVDIGGGTAISGTDYNGFGTQTVSFAAGSVHGATANVTLSVTNDSLVEGSETVQLRLQNLRPTVSGQAALGNVNSAVTIQDNDTATIAIQPTKTIVEQSGPQTIMVTLTTSDGAGGAATLAPGITLRADVVDVGGGTATSGTDYEAFGTQAVTFGPNDGNSTSKTVTLVPIRHSQLEPDRSVNLRLQSLNQTLNGSAGLGNTNSVVTIRDNPATAELHGFAYIDTNSNGQREAAEFGIPGVSVTLTGADLAGNAVRLVAMTADDGSYGFIALPAGIYAIVETQPAVYLDSADTIGSQGGATSNDQFTSIQLEFDEIGRDNNFGERGLAPQFVTIRLFLGSTLVDASTLRSTEAHGTQSSGNVEQAAAIRNRSIPSIVRLPAPPAGEGESRPISSSVVPPPTSPVVGGEGESAASLPVIANSVVKPASLATPRVAVKRMPTKLPSTPIRPSLPEERPVSENTTSTREIAHPTTKSTESISLSRQERDVADLLIWSGAGDFTDSLTSILANDKRRTVTSRKMQTIGEETRQSLVVPRVEPRTGERSGVSNLRDPISSEATAFVFGQDDSIFDPLGDLYDEQP